MVSRISFCAITLLPLLFVGGCTSGSVSSRMSTAAAAGPSARVTVNNRHLADIGVYAIVSGHRYKLGSVQPFGVGTFRIPRIVQLPSDVELFVFALSTDQKFQSASILLEPGDHIVLNFENTAQFSSILRR